MKYIYVALMWIGGFALGLPIGMTATEHLIISACKSAGYVVVKNVRMTCR